VQPEEVVPALRRLGFSERDADALAAHFLDAERRGKRGHGLARVGWLATLPDLDPTAAPRLVSSAPGYELWDGDGALGYLTLSAIADRLVAEPPEPARVVVARRCFPTGMLGYWARRLAAAGLVSLLTATSPPRLPHPDAVGHWIPGVGSTEPGNERRAGSAGAPRALVPTIPLAIGVPSSDGRHLVADVSMAKRTYGEVLAGLASPDDLVPFGGEQAHKAFALAAGLTLAAEALAGHDRAAIVVAARATADPVPGFRERAGGLRLPGDG
jgi:LDH2 family malate/lactate/ureidoglycolate dehydrogenase